MKVRGIRGAVRIRALTKKAIHEGTVKMVKRIIRTNKVNPEDICSCLFTVTPDLRTDFPAYAVHRLPGWKYVPMTCAQELDIPGMMDRVVRVLLHVNTDLPQKEIQHQYLGETKCLRPDLASDRRTSTRRK